MRCAVTTHQRDAERFELVAHRWIDAGVGALDRNAQATRERSDTAHEGAADAENVHTHGGKCP
jgi:hypothetical protein